MSTKKTGIFIIYKATSPSGKSYIGMTSGTMENRRSEHMYNSKSTCRTKFHKALKKCGDNFNWEVIACSKTAEDAYFIEQHLISTLNTKNEGYNLSDGGLGASGFTFENITARRPVIRLDTFEIYNSGIEAARELDIDVSDLYNVCYGNRAHVKGIVFRSYKRDSFYKFTPRYKKDESGFYGCKNRRVLPKNIICNEDSKVFDTIKALCENYNISRKTLRTHLNKNTKTVRGLSFNLVE